MDRDLKRSVVDLSTPDNYLEYDKIDHFRSLGRSFAWTSGKDIDKSTVDTTFGWINDTDVRDAGDVQSVAAIIPNSVNFAGPYLLKYRAGGGGKGKGYFSNGTWTLDSVNSVNVTENGNGDYSFDDDSRIVVNYSGPERGRDELFFHVYETDSDHDGSFVSGLAMIRLEDEADFDAGKKYRRGWKNAFIGLNPRAIRSMNATELQTCSGRWEQRQLPDDISRQRNIYRTPGATGGDDMVFSAVADTPEAATHQWRVWGSSTSIAGRGYQTIASIVDIGSGVAEVTLSSDLPASWVTGRRVMFTITGGMPELDRDVSAITVTGSNKFTCDDIDISGYTAFSAGKVSVHVTAKVGDWDAYPVLDRTGLPVCYYGINSGAAITMVLDKTVPGTKGTVGAWVYLSDYYARQSQPIEDLRDFIKEINDETLAGPVDMVLTFPFTALLSCDPDYAAESSPVIQALNILLDDETGLQASVSIWPEDSNEKWNFPPNYFGGDTDRRRSFVRWGVEQQYAMHGFRSSVMVSDAKAAFPEKAHLIKGFLAGQGVAGAVNSGVNAAVIYGNSYTQNDPRVDGGDPRLFDDPPVAYHDVYTGATYSTQPADFYNEYLADFITAFFAASTDEDREAVYAEWAEGLDVLGGTGENYSVANWRDVRLPIDAANMLAFGKFFGGYEGGFSSKNTPNVGTPQQYYNACAIRSVTKASNAVVTTRLPHHREADDVVSFVMDWGMTELHLVQATVLSVGSSTTMTIDIDTTGFSDFKTGIVGTPEGIFRHMAKDSAAVSAKMRTLFDAYRNTDGAGLPACYNSMGLDDWGNTLTHDTYRAGVEGAGFLKMWDMMVDYNDLKKIEIVVQ